MYDDLKLKAPELVVYSVIFSFTKTGKFYSGGMTYLSKITNYSKRALFRIIQDLLKKGLIIKTADKTNGVPNVKYKTANVSGLMKNRHGDGEKSSYGYGNNFRGGMNYFPGGAEKCSDNNTNNNTIDNALYNAIASREREKSETEFNEFDPFGLFSRQMAQI